MVLEAPQKSTSEPVWTMSLKYRKLPPKPQEPRVVLHSFQGPHELVSERQKPTVPYLITFHLLVNNTPTQPGTSFAKQARRDFEGGKCCSGREPGHLRDA